MKAQTAAYGTWASAGQLTASRNGAAAATLQDGRILITGGTSAGVPLSSTEFYNGSGFAQAPSMSVPRKNHTSATLNDGRVVVAGGYTIGNVPTNSIEIYNPVSNSWSSVPGGLSEPRAEHTMTVMQDGRVLIAGGMGGAGQPVATLEIFDPKTNTSMPVAVTMSSPRMDHAAALLANGAVVLAGGFDGNNVLSSVDAFDPASGSMGSPLSMASPRRYLTATTLLDGRVLLAGGHDGSKDVATLEIANLASQSITGAGSLVTARSQHAAIRLPDNGGVLIAGGESAGSPVASAELFSPVTGTVQSAGSMSTARVNAAAAWLAVSGKDEALVAGGDSGATASTGDVYSFPDVQTDKPEYAPNTTVTVTGKGWAPGETVTLVFHESPAGDPDRTFTSTVDAAGSFQNTDFQPDHHDEGMNLILTATGSQSGETAQTAFADSTYPTQMINLTPGTGQVGSNITVSATLQYGVPYYVPEYYYYSCDCYSCDCGWFSCSTCCNTCEGVNYVFGGYDYYDLTSQTVGFYFNNDIAFDVATDVNGNATATLTVPPGATQLSVSYPGSSDGTYGASIQTVTFTVTPGPTALAAASPTATYAAGGVTLGATLTSNGSFVPNETVSFSIAGNAACSGTTNTIGVAQCSASLTGLNVGAYAISATFAGDSNYVASSATGSLTVNQATQTITFPAITGEQVASTSFILPATASSGLPLTVSSTTPEVCTVSGSTVSLLEYGVCTIEASQAGNGNYGAASMVSQTFQVHHATQTISFAPIAGQMVNTTLSLSATASSNLPVSFTSATPGVCTVSGSTASLIATGTCSIEASQAGNDVYMPESLTHSFLVNKATQTITFPAVSGEQVVLTSVALAANASSGLPVTFSSTTPAVCTVSGNTASLLVYGNCILEASQAGNSLYDAAPSVSMTFLVHHASQTISFAPIPSQIVNTTLNLSATASSGLPLTFLSTTTGVCTVSGTTASLIATGTCAIEASQAGNSVYMPESLTHSFSVTLPPQTITFTPISGDQYASTSVALSATASSGLPVTFSSTTPAVCTVSGNTASLLVYGNCILEATQAGSSSYAPATASQMFLVRHASQTISFAPIPGQPVNTTLNLSATASSGLPVTFSSTTTGVCTVSGTTATLNAAGTCTIEATQAGNNVYMPESLTHSFSVTQ